jgi:hypothetical protein
LAASSTNTEPHEHLFETPHPPLSLASLRVRGRLAELRAAELAHDEARAVLTAAGVHLTDDQVARLVERAEGWPAATLRGFETRFMLRLGTRG